MANCNPPLATRFPVNRPARPHTQKHPNGYLTCKLKKLLLKKKFRYEDPETNEIKQMVGADAIVIKYVWEALQGNVPAIEGIFDRIDGKLGNNDNGKGMNATIIVRIGDKPGLLSPTEASDISHQRS